MGPAHAVANVAAAVLEWDDGRRADFGGEDLLDFALASAELNTILLVGILLVDATV